MTAIRNYPKDFVERSVRLLYELDDVAKEKDLEVTFLLNCLLGMVVSVLEHLSKLEKAKSEDYDKNLFKIKLNDERLKSVIPEKIKAIKSSTLNEAYAKQINEKEFLKYFELDEFTIESTTIKFISKDDLRNYELSWFLKKIRNGIAHQNLAPTSGNDKWKGIRIWNYNTNGYKDFAVEFSVVKLRAFSIEVANRYLESLTKI